MSRYSMKLYLMNYSKTQSEHTALESSHCNPFGFTPYDSGDMIGNYAFSDKFITAVKVIQELDDEEEQQKTLQDNEQ